MRDLYGVELTKWQTALVRKKKCVIESLSKSTRLSLKKAFIIFVTGTRPPKKNPRSIPDSAKSAYENHSFILSKISRKSIR